MTSFIGVRFQGLEHDPSVESAIHRWVVRLESMRIEVLRANVMLEPAGRRRTQVGVTMTLVDGTVRTAVTSHADIYVAVADAFRSVRHQTLPPPPTRPRYAFA